MEVWDDSYHKEAQDLNEQLSLSLVIDPYIVVDIESTPVIIDGDMVEEGKKVDGIYCSFCGKKIEAQVDREGEEGPENENFSISYNCKCKDATKYKDLLTSHKRTQEDLFSFLHETSREREAAELELSYKIDLLMKEALDASIKKKREKLKDIHR
jgi:hypothetical protein